ncbi:MAG: hypothetical protein ACRDMZ_04090, partial [Solirubrobacteraceae bacterium]
MKNAFSPLPANHGRVRSMFWLAALAGLVACGQGPLGPAIGSDAISDAPSTNDARRTITMITGDRVTVGGAGGARSVYVEAG